jgi:hypothetical protein
VGLRADAVGAGGAGGGNQRVVREVLGERGRLLGGGDDVDVLTGLGPAAQRTRHLDSLRGRMLAQRCRQLLGDRLHLREQEAAGTLAGLAQPLQRREDVLLGLRAEAFDVADLFFLTGCFQVLHRGDFELLEEAPGRFRADAGDAGDLDQGRRELRLQLHGGGDLTGLDQRVDLFRQRLADAGDLRRCCRRAPGI